MIIRTYEELRRFKTFEERFRYLMLRGEVADVTFGHNRYLNQALYRSYEWKKVRDEVIVRDRGCDLGMEGYDIFEKILIHHMNPVTLDQIKEKDPILFDPRYLITTTHTTHNAIHYGDTKLIDDKPIERRPGDTCPWRRRW